VRGVEPHLAERLLAGLVVALVVSVAGHEEIERVAAELLRGARAYDPYNPQRLPNWNDRRAGPVKFGGIAWNEVFEGADDSSGGWVSLVVCRVVS
jgi:hypothetical protein